MSRPILSRPRTRVYGCNYDKGESYYKPMVDHLDRKYSARPLFSEPRTSLADEIAARRNDIGSRDLSDPRNSSFGRDLDLELDSPIRTPQLPQLPLTSLATDTLFPENEEIVYDSRGQRSRRRFAENFANDVAATTHHLKTKLAAINLDDEVDVALGKPRRIRQEPDLLETTLNSRRDMQDMKSAIEEAETAVKRRSKLFDEIDRMSDNKSTFTKWSKLVNEDENLIPISAAATRAKQTKARLNDLESEMEELAERQAKRERRAAALRALINENAAETENIQEQSVLSSRTLNGNRNDFYDDLDFLYDRGVEDNFEDEFVLGHRRYKERAAAAFAEDLAELRRKRRDMQDRIFDVIDLNAEIEKAKTTLEAADVAFQRHATRFDNTGQYDDEALKKVAHMDIVSEKPRPKPIKWIKVPNVDIESCVPQPTKPNKGRNNSVVEAADIVDPLNTLALLPLKRKFLKRKKSVSF